MSAYDEHMNNLQLQQANYLLGLVEKRLYKDDELEALSRAQQIIDELQINRTLSTDA